MPRRDPKICGDIRKSVENWRKYFRENIQQYHDYHNFVLGSQWEDDEEQLLKNYNKIPLQFNKLAPLMNHLLGEQMMNTPNLQAVPDDDVVDEQTVSVRQALVKEISLDSNAKTVYQIAFQQAAIGGFGAYLVGTDYKNNKSFDQVPIIKSYRDATKCFWDVGCESPCKTDGMISGAYVRMSRQLFAKKYGKKLEGSIPPTVTETEDDSYASFKWCDDESITITEAYKRKLIKSQLHELSNGETITSKELTKFQTIVVDNISQEDAEEQGRLPPGEYINFNGEPVTIVQSRSIIEYKTTWYKIAGDYVLDETPFPSQQLPVVFVDQNSYYDKTGKQVTRPFVKDARDAQRFINYLGTQIAYLIKISRYDQFMASRANVKSPKTQLIWKNPSIIQGAIIYDVDKEGGTKPEQLRPPELPISLIQQYERALQDIQTSTGIYDTKVGEQGNENSGAAIDARTRQGAYNTYIVFNSLNRAIAVGGEIIDEMIPKLFDTERKVTLELPDQGRKTVTLNQQADEYGSGVSNDMSKGTFKIRLMPGPSYEGQKAESLQAMQLLLNAHPEIFTLIADLYAQNLPVPNVIELVNRLRTIVPPEVMQAGKTGKPVQQDKGPPPELMLKLKELALKEKDMQLKEATLRHTMQKDDVEAQLKVQEIVERRMEVAAQIQEQILRYQAETHRTNTDEQISHAQNIVEILTRPNHLNQQSKVA
jgi:hypothetical protein